MFDIFKAYDIRGIYPTELDETAAARIGEAFAAVRKPKTVAVGRDVRASGLKLKESLVKALLASGVNVVDIGTITTDQLYFAVGNYGYDGGISVTASHNPGEYNGFKFSESGGAPIASETLLSLRDWVASNKKTSTTKPGKLSSKEILDDYTRHVLSYINPAAIKPLKVVANANFGAVGRSIDQLSKVLHFKPERLNWEEDGTFPKGPPNPLLPENRDETVVLIKKSGADFGVAWDADADRVFFFTGDGAFIPSPFIIAILAEQFLRLNPGAKIIHDVTTSWVIDEAVMRNGGLPITNRTGHTFIKARMRTEDAVFAGESSGHYYFRDSFYADNGVVPFLMILEMVSKTGRSLGELVKSLMGSYKLSGEINFKVKDPAAAIKQVERQFGSQGKVDRTDGLVIESSDWRLSIRPSNTEPLFRLNAEARDQKVLDNLVAQISSLINT